jgi:hypothetical protein
VRIDLIMWRKIGTVMEVANEMQRHPHQDSPSFMAIEKSPIVSL